jgi:hypothetical protein
MRNAEPIPLRIVHPPLPKARNGNADDDAVEVEGHKPLIPDGPYLAKYVGHDTALLFARAPKVFLHFEILDGEHARTRLVRPYRALRLKGKAGPGGKFVLSAGGDLYRTLVRLLDVRTRPDRISVRDLRSGLFRIHARTVDRDRDGNNLAQGARYSVIGRIEDAR